MTRRRRLTLDDARKLDHGELNDLLFELLQPYEAPDMETPGAREMRIGKTLDELPDIYAWFLQLHNYFDHWTTFQAQQFGMKSTEYLGMRLKRDMMENAARAAKLRYEGTSRRLTQLLSAEEEARMPRGRS